MFSHLSLITSNTRPLVTKFWEQKAAEMSAQVCVQVFECLTTCVCARALSQIHVFLHVSI